MVVKRLTTAILLLCVILAFSACGHNTEDTGSISSESQSVTESSTQDSSEISSTEPSETNEPTKSSQSSDNPTGMIDNSQTNNSGTNTPSKTQEQNGAAKNTTSKPSAVEATGVKLDITVKVLEIGGTIQLTATVSPSNATNKTVTWDSNNKSIATVDGNGKVTAKAAGTAVITVKTANNKIASCTVKVNAPAPKSAFDKPYDIGAMKSELIAYGKSIGMTHITHQPADFGGGQITPEGTTWLPPQETWIYGSKAGAKLKQDLCDHIKKWKSLGESTFTLWFEKDSNHSGEYIVYVIIG